MRTQTQVRWGLDNGVWTMGGPTYADFIRRTTAYTLEGIADRVTAPTLIMDAEDDQFLAGQPEILRRAMTVPTTLGSPPPKDPASTATTARCCVRAKSSSIGSTQSWPPGSA